MIQKQQLAGNVNYISTKENLLVTGDYLRVLCGIPVYNEESYLYHSLQLLIQYINDNVNNHDFDYLVVDDGSTDNTNKEFKRVFHNHPEENLLYYRHYSNLGYGYALITIFKYAKENNYDYVITFDADLQHDPSTIPLVIEQAGNGIDFVSASRYLEVGMIKTPETIPYDRYLINMMITRLFNETFDISLTDSFCGLKGYKVSKIDPFLNLEERGYAMPLELLLTAKKQEMTFTEVPTPCIYLENRRTRKDWRKRIQTYARAIEKFSWTTNQTSKAKVELAKIMEMLEFRLSEMKTEGEKLDYLPFYDFWKETVNFWIVNSDNFGEKTISGL
ncbi:MAG: glycosyltransferase family 2 protein [Candidatus Hodarchaeales archaeon]